MSLVLAADTLGDTSDQLLGVMEVAGTVAFSLSGALAARRANMDWFGVIVLGVIVAVGGGTLRDVVLGQLPVSWIEDGWPVPLAAAVAAATLLPRVHHAARHWPTVRNSVLAADAVGLATFAVVGADVGLDAGTTRWVAAMLGIVSAVFGGIFRDVLINERPVVLVGEVYALAAALGASLHVVLVSAGWHDWLTVWIPVLLALSLRAFVLLRPATTRT